MNWKKSVSLVAVAVVGLGLAGCGDDESGGGEGLGTLTVLDAGVGIIYFASYLAEDRGYFSDEKLDVKMLGGTAGGQDVTAALVSGDADIIQATTGNVIATREQGLDLKAIAPLMEINGVSLVVRNDVIAKLNLPDNASVQEKMTALADYGAKVGISSAGSGVDTFMRGLCKTYDVSCDDQLKLVALGGMGENQAAFQQGQIDVVARSHPDVDLLGSTSDGTVLIGADDVAAAEGNYLSSVLITRDATISERRPALVAYLRALQKAFQYAQAHPEETQAFVHKQVDPDLADDVFADAWNTLKTGIPADVVIDEDGVNAYYALEKEIKGKDPTVAKQDIYTTELAKEAKDAVADFKP